MPVMPDNMMLVRLADGSMVMVPKVATPGTGAAPGAGAPAGPGGSAGDPAPPAAQPQPSQSPEDAAEEERKRKLLDPTEKLDADGYRSLLIMVNPVGPKQDTLEDELRAANTPEEMNDLFSKGVRRETLVGAVTRAGLAPTDYQKERATRGHLMQLLQAARVQ